MAVAFDKGPVSSPRDVKLWSAAAVLKYLKDIIKIETIIIFDDFNEFAGDDNHGDRRALKEFKARNPSFKMKYLWKFGPYGEAFEVIAT